ncbi:MAG: hypothetical protein QXU32_08810 [Nitrososphaerales archaeon]
MARMFTGNLIGPLWHVALFFSRLDKLGEGAMPSDTFLSHGLSITNYMNRFLEEIEEFVDNLIDDGDETLVACGYGLMSVGRSAFPAYMLWIDASEQAHPRPIIASLLVARSLDMCCIICSPSFGGISTEFTIPLSFVRVVLNDDGKTVQYQGVSVDWLSVGSDLCRQTGNSVASAIFPTLTPKTGALLIYSDRDFGDMIGQLLSNHAPIIQTADCGCLSFSKRASIDKALAKTGELTQTMLARIPAGGGFSGNLLRFEKGGHFTGVAKEI